LYAALGINSVIKYEMSGVCGIKYGGEEKCIQDYGWEDRRKIT